MLADCCVDVRPGKTPPRTRQDPHQIVQKHKHLCMYTRTRGYSMIYDITIIMLLMLYAVILKTLKNNAFLHVYAYRPPGTLNIVWLLDRVLDQEFVKKISRWLQDGPRWSKMAQDGRRWPHDGNKMAPRWHQAGSQSCLGGAFR